MFEFQEGASSPLATEATNGEVQSDGLAPAKDAYADDTDEDGSGLEPDESSGSGWGAGPGPDDEDGRGSGDAPLPGLPEDDEDFAPRTSTPSDIGFEWHETEDSARQATDKLDTVPSTPEPSTEAPILIAKPFNVDVRE